MLVLEPLMCQRGLLQRKDRVYVRPDCASVDELSNHVELVSVGMSHKADSPCIVLARVALRGRVDSGDNRSAVLQHGP